MLISHWALANRIQVSSKGLLSSTAAKAEASTNGFEVLNWSRRTPLLLGSSTSDSC